MNVMSAVKRLLGMPNGEPAHARPDPLRDLIERANASEHDAWAAINASRRQRGERPLAPDWSDLLRQPRERNGAGPD